MFASDLDPTDREMDLLQRWCACAQRCRIPEFVKSRQPGQSATHRAGILAWPPSPTVSPTDATNASHKIRTLINRAYGFHTAEAALAFICSPADRSSSNSQPHLSRSIHVR